VIRYADDFVIGFREESDARRCLAALRERFSKFGLELHPDKTRLIEFGRSLTAIQRRFTKDVAQRTAKAQSTGKTSDVGEILKAQSTLVTDAEDPSSLSQCEVCQSTSKDRPSGDSLRHGTGCLQEG